VIAIKVMSIMALGTAYLASPEMQQLTADMREAMRRANWDGKQTARVIGVSQQRLSDQLLNKEDFTLLRKFTRLPRCGASSP
jgi:transcriptional regulator with AAA-type ATPase domain